MSAPFAMLCGKRASQFDDKEIAERAFKAFNRWALLSSDKHVSLDEVAWVGAMLVKAMKAAGTDILKTETRDANGARVVGLVASDGVLVKDGAA